MRVEERYAPLPFSWRGVACEFVNLLSHFAYSTSDFLDTVADELAHSHNKFVDEQNARSNGEKFARDVLSGLDSL